MQTVDGVDLWVDDFVLEGAVATRLKVDARRRDPELFAEDMDPGLLGRLLFMDEGYRTTPGSPQARVSGTSSPTAHSIEQNGTGRPQTSVPQVSHRELGDTHTSQVGSPQGGSPVDAFETDDSFSIPFMGCTLTGWTVPRCRQRRGSTSPRAESSSWT